MTYNLIFKKYLVLTILVALASCTGDFGASSGKSSVSSSKKSSLSLSTNSTSSTTSTLNVSVNDIAIQEFLLTPDNTNKRRFYADVRWVKPVPNLKLAFYVVDVSQNYSIGSDYCPSNAQIRVFDTNSTSNSKQIEFNTSATVSTTYNIYVRGSYNGDAVLSNCSISQQFVYTVPVPPAENLLTAPTSITIKSDSTFQATVSSPDTKPTVRLTGGLAFDGAVIELFAVTDAAKACSDTTTLVASVAKDLADSVDVTLDSNKISLVGGVQTKYYFFARIKSSSGVSACIASDKAAQYTLQFSGPPPIEIDNVTVTVPGGNGTAAAPILKPTVRVSNGGVYNGVVVKLYRDKDCTDASYVATSTATGASIDVIVPNNLPYGTSYFNVKLNNSDCSNTDTAYTIYEPSKVDPSSPRIATSPDYGWGNQHTFAVLSRQLYKAWGDNNASTSTGSSLGIGDISISKITNPKNPNSPSIATGNLMSTASNPIYFESIGAGLFGGCGLTNKGDIYCWGFNRSDYGTIGAGGVAGDQDPKTAPASKVKVRNDTNNAIKFKYLSVGGWNACGISEANDIYCWGYNGNGTLGNGNTTVSYDAQQVLAGGAKFIQVSTGVYHTCAVTKKNGTASEDGEIMCWGSNQWGQLGLGDMVCADTKMPCRIDMANAKDIDNNRYTFKSVSVTSHGASATTCALTTNGYAFCWGSNGSGRIGNNSSAASFSKAMPVYTNVINNTDRTTISNATYDSISVGETHVCAVLTNNRGLACWGDGSQGQLGQTSSGTVKVPGTSTLLKTADSSIPVLVDFTNLGATVVKEVSAGGFYTCLRNDKNGVSCWGKNQKGQLGIGDNDLTNRYAPTSQDKALPDSL